MPEAKIVAVMNLKGGVGKSTTCITLAMSFLNRGFKVLIIDRDPQLACLRVKRSWQGLPDTAPQVIDGCSVINYVKHLEATMNMYDVIIVDCPPVYDPDLKVSAAVAEALKNGTTPMLPKVMLDTLRTADLAIIPLTPSGPDYATTREAKSLVSYVKQVFRPELKAALLATRMLPNQLMQGFLQALSSDELPLLGHGTTSCYGWTAPMSLYKSIYEIVNTQKARTELDAIANDVLQLIELPMQSASGEMK